MKYKQYPLSKMLKIQIIMGSTRQGRFVEQPAQWIFKKLKQQEGVEVELIDLRDWPLPFYDEPVSPSMMTMMKKDYVNDLAKKWAKKIGEADGYIMVVPEYNHGYPAVLKNAIDYVYTEWNNKPIAFMSYGGSAGGTRAVQQLRQVAIELQMVPIRNGVHVPMYWEHVDEKGIINLEAYDKNAEALFEQLISLAKVFKASREASK